MTKTIRTLSENGVFRPTAPVDRPERCAVVVEVRQVKAAPKKPPREDVEAIRSERFHTGEPVLAAGPNEHHP